MTPRQASKHLRQIHVQIVRAEIETGPIPLSLIGDARHRWAQRGLTLKQRDQAAQLLVRYGEAIYRGLPVANIQGDVVHLVAVKHLDELERLVAEGRWLGKAS